MRKTKPICACDSEAPPPPTGGAGKNVTRFHFSHGDHEEGRVRMERIKRVRKNAT